MKITTKMKRAATGERGGKTSKNICSSSKLITMGIDPEKPEAIFKKKKKSKKPKEAYVVGDTIRVSAISLYSPSIKKDSVERYNRRSELLRSKFRELARMWGLNYQIDLVITRVVIEGNTRTYYGDYLGMEVAIDDHFNSIKRSQNEY